MKIELTEFAKRHFNSSFKGTKILDVSIEDFLTRINKEYNKFSLDVFNNATRTDIDYSNSIIRKGYAGFCIQLFIKNDFSDALSGTMKLSKDVESFIRTEYVSRRDEELPVLSRWLDVPSDIIPKAKWFNVILYDKNHLYKEWESLNDGSDFELSDNCQWGIVAILGQLENEEEPMKPSTMLRNYMPLDFGGSGMKYPTLKHDKNKFNEVYNKSVDFWSKNITVK